MSLIHLGTMTTLASEVSVGDPANGDTSNVYHNSQIVLMTFNSTSTDAEDIVNHPYKLRPDDYAGAGVWIETSLDQFIGSGDSWINWDGSSLTITLANSGVLNLYGSMTVWDGGDIILVGNDADPGKLRFYAPTAAKLVDAYIDSTNGNFYIESTAAFPDLYCYITGWYLITLTSTYITLAASGITVSDNAWIGLGAAKGRIEFDDQTVDEVNILAARLGVGTSTPGNLVHLYEAAADCVLKIESETDDAVLVLDSGEDGTTEASIIKFQDNGTNKWRIEKTAGNDFLIYDYTRSGISFRVVDNGNMYLMEDGGVVGIGTTSPSAHAGLTIEQGELCLKETTTPTADADYGKIYCKADNKLYFQDGAGAEHEVSLAT